MEITAKKLSLGSAGLSFGRIKATNLSPTVTNNLKKLIQHIIIIALFTGVQSYGQNNFEEIDDYASKVEFTSIDSLAQNITAKSHTDLEKARALFIWVASNIGYDFELLNSYNLQQEFYVSDYVTNTKTLERKKGICSGYALLYKTLCDDIGLESEIINGNSSSWLSTVLGQDDNRHAWNTVKINNEWKLLDVTWAGKNDDNEIDDFWFQTNPEYFIYSHYPDDEKWTLLNRSFSEEMFLDLPAISDYRLFEDNIKIILPTNKTLKVDKTRIINIEIETKNTSRSIMLLGSPWETYASKNNLKSPSNEEYSKLTEEEKNKFNLIIPSITILKKEIEENRVLIQAQITSENIEEFDLIIENNTIRTYNLTLE